MAFSSFPLVLELVRPVHVLSTSLTVRSRSCRRGLPLLPDPCRLPILGRLLAVSLGRLG